MEKEIEKLKLEIEKLKLELELEKTRKSMPFQAWPYTPSCHFHNGMPCYQNPCVWC